MSNVNRSLRSLNKNERMSKWLVFFEQIAHSLFFSQKTSDSLRKPMNEFPTLQKCVLLLRWHPKMCASIAMPPENFRFYRDGTQNVSLLPRWYPKCLPSTEMAPKMFPFYRDGTQNVSLLLRWHPKCFPSTEMAPKMFPFCRDGTQNVSLLLRWHPKLCVSAEKTSKKSGAKLEGTKCGMVPRGRIFKT